jgi:ABC-2 type transport system ATP-binding protein
MTHAIETVDLARRFGKTRAVDGLNLVVPEGAVYALLGPNGAGKTTTLKMLVNVVAPTGGHATVLGVDSRRLGPTELAQIGCVSESQALPEWMTVAQLVDFCRPLYPTWDDAFCARLLAQFALPPDKRLRDLSRGMRMKASLLSSLAYRPRLLLLDEPFSGLDVLVRDELIRGVLELSDEARWTVVVSSHDIDEVERLADWVGVMNEGRLALAEPVAALQERYRRVEVTLPETASPPASHPPAWLEVAVAGRRLSFVHTAYRAGESDAEIDRLVGAAPVVAPMTLREIFLALARTYRLGAGGASAPHGAAA